MPPSIPAPARQIPLEPLTPSAFAPFGTVIENPARTGRPPQAQAVGSSGGGPRAERANQGTALKYADVAALTDHYHTAPSGKPARAAMSMFVCSPRALRGGRFLDVAVLERHPFTPQTFIPMGQPAGASDDDDDDNNGGASTTLYLVIVAPTLPPATTALEKGKKTKRPPPFPAPEPRPRRQRRRSLLDVFSRARPEPFTNEAVPPARPSALSAGASPPKGPGLPDLSRARAFVARGNQAVTYGAGTWHAPMCVLGADDIDFVVVQFANGVGMEDCQEVELKAEGGGEGLSVAVDGSVAVPGAAVVVKARL